MSALEASKQLAFQSGCRLIQYHKDNTLTKRDWAFVDFRLSECEPVDLLGKLMQVDKVVVYIPFKWIVTLSSSRGTLLLDEFFDAHRPDVKSVSYKLVFDRKDNQTLFFQVRFSSPSPSGCP